jgi:hypothetical protein
MTTGLAATPRSAPVSTTGGNIRLFFSRYNTPLTIAAGIAPPILYFLYVNHFAVNALQFDDWSFTPVVESSLDGNVSISQLWLQHLETRSLLPRALYVIFGFADGLNVRSVIFLSAAIFAISMQFFSPFSVAISEGRSRRSQSW